MEEFPMNLLFGQVEFLGNNREGQSLFNPSFHDLKLLTA